MTGKATITLVLASILAACVQRAAVEPQSVGSDYTIGGGEWDSGGGITIVARAFERDGTTIVCGAWTTDQQSAVSATLNENVIEAASIYAGKTRLVQNLNFMRRVRYAENIAGAPVNCVASAKPWLAEFATDGARVEIPRLQFILDDEDNNRVTFRQSARPDIVN